MSIQFARLLLLISLAFSAETFAQKTDAPEAINVMTFNIRYASATGANAWPKRRASVVKVIRDSKADLIGTQEGLHHQLVYLDQELKDHKWIGIGREGGVNVHQRD